MKPLLTLAITIASLSPVLPGFSQDADVHQGNWISWRGPLQTGVSLESYADYEFDPNPVWTDPISGRGNPVVFKGRIYSWGYRGSGAELMEVLQARDEKTGKVIWERETQEFMSDTAYSRYTIGAPTVDAATGNIYLANTYGEAMCFDPDGKVLWYHSMVERFGRLTFPNGRAGAPVIDGDICIIRGVTAYWGADGPARDRFFGFDKLTGEILWSSTPGVGPPYLKDSSFSTPYLATVDGRRVFYAGTGCGNIVCVNVNDGTPIWRFQVSKGGVNASPVVFKDKVIGIHGAENMDTTETGRLYAIKYPTDLDAPGGAVEEGQGGAPKLGPEAEAWRYTFEQFNCSPLIHDGKIYQMDKTGEMICVDAETGKVLWEIKLANEQLFASPAYADGKLYVTTSPGWLHVIDVTGAEPKEVAKVDLDGECVGSPTICNGRVYVHTMQKLYAFQIKNSGISWAKAPAVERPAPGAPAKLMAVPSDVLLAPGGSQAVKLYTADAAGNRIAPVEQAEWATFIPPTAKVKATMDASFNGNTIAAAAEAKESAGAWKATAGGLSGILRGRVAAKLPYTQNFDSFALPEEHPLDKVKFGHPPLSWIGARLKWDVREIEGNKVLAKTLDTVLFQRGLTFIGEPNLKNYTVQADVMTDGNRRIKSVVGLINQRYIISLVGNSNILEVSSNHEHFKESVPFPISAMQWYTLKTRVDIAADGSGVIRAKAWKKGEAEPEAWSIEATHKDAHLEGAPGVFGFAPQAQKSVFIDNISVTPN
jgi:outer membrane protein assembly factor BamB